MNKNNIGNIDNNDIESLYSLEVNNNKIFILGTAHVSKKSSEETAVLIEKLKPNYIAVELDNARYHQIMQTNENERWRNLDIYKVIREGKAFLVIIQIILSSFQKKLARDQGIHPGDEMRTAILKAKENNIPIILADRNIEITLKRAWNQASIWEKSKIIASLFSSQDKNITRDEIEKLKEQDVLSKLIEELAKEVPNVKKVLIDERDEVIASKILEGTGIIFAVIGAGHVKGIVKNLKAINENKKNIDIKVLNEVPKKTINFLKVFSILFSLILILLIISAFYFKDLNFAFGNLKSWILVNSLASGIVAFILRAHILTILTAAFGSPIFSLIPFIGTGIVSGIVEAYINKPKVKDFENLQDDLVKFKGYFKNKITRILLIVLGVNIGSAIGTIIGFKFLLNIFN